MEFSITRDNTFGARHDCTATIVYNGCQIDDQQFAIIRGTLEGVHRSVDLGGYIHRSADMMKTPKGIVVCARYSSLYGVDESRMEEDLNSLARQILRVLEAFV